MLSFLKEPCLCRISSLLSVPLRKDGGEWREGKKERERKTGREGKRWEKKGREGR